MPAFDLCQEDQDYLLRLARYSIAEALQLVKADFPQNPTGTVLTPGAGAFVTLRKHGQLRGCIGRMAAEIPLQQTIRLMAVAAAFEDPRFRPLTRHEFDQIEIEISVLSPMQQCSVEQLEVGKHGVWLGYQGRSAVFLPQVAAEQGWNRDQLLEHLCQKAGLAADAYKQPSAVLRCFTALVFSETVSG